MKDYLPEACPHGDSMILDSEVLMVDLKTGNPLPFGTLGIHKVCTHNCVFMCMHFCLRIIHVVVLNSCNTVCLINFTEISI